MMGPEEQLSLQMENLKTVTATVEVLRLHIPKYPNILFVEQFTQLRSFIALSDVLSAVKAVTAF